MFTTTKITFILTNCIFIFYLICIPDCTQPTLIGDGFCNYETNNFQCNFDGGDCCAACETIVISLKSNAKIAQDGLGGIYHKSSIVNGKTSWNFTIKAIWYDQEYNNWKVGPLDYIGTSIGGIVSDFGNGCPFDQPSDEWSYRDGWNGNWTRAGTNEIIIQCLEGNFLIF